MNDETDQPLIQRPAESSLEEFAERGRAAQAAVNAEIKKAELPFECSKCGWRGKSPAALRMHNIRKHTKGSKTAGNFRRGQQTREERLAHRRAYQHQLRERYYREGKDSRGQLRPPGWKPRRRSIKALRRLLVGYPSEQPEYKRRKYREKVKEYRAAGLNAKGQPLKGSNKSQRMSVAMKESWAKRRTAGPEPIVTNTDPLSDAAKAILLAAKVLRGTLTALKLP
jgi:hypothetical protein